MHKRNARWGHYLTLCHSRVVYQSNYHSGYVRRVVALLKIWELSCSVAVVHSVFGLLAVKGREVFSSKFTFTPTTTLVSYMPKKNRKVVLLSTRHAKADISDREDRKLVIVLNYNSNKGGVDNLDKVIGTYSCRRMAACWPWSSSTTFSTSLPTTPSWYGERSTLTGCRASGTSGACSYRSWERLSWLRSSHAGSASPARRRPPRLWGL